MRPSKSFAPSVVATAQQMQAAPSSPPRFPAGHNKPLSRWTEDPLTAINPIILFASDTALPPATGRAQAPLMRQVTPRRIAFGSGDSWSGVAVYADANANVAPWLMGLEEDEVQQVVHKYYTTFLRHIAAATLELNPLTAAATLERLAGEHRALLSSIAPGGSSLVLAVPTGIEALIERCLDCCHQLALAGNKQGVFDVATAATIFLSHLVFASPASVAQFKDAWQELRGMIRAAVTPATPVTACPALSADAAANTDTDAPAASLVAPSCALPAVVSQEAAVRLYEACARADGCLWATPWFGHRFLAAVEAHQESGWSTAELAVRFAVAWGVLMLRKRFTAEPGRIEALVAAVAAHAVSSHQLAQMDAACATLPTDLLLAVRQQLLRMVEEEQRLHLQHCGTAKRLQRAEECQAAAVVEVVEEPVLMALACGEA